MILDGNCSVNSTPSLIHLVACAAGAVAVPIQTTPPSRTTSTPPAPPSRSGAPATTADNAADRAYLPNKTIADGAAPVDQSPTAQFIHSAHHLHCAPVDATTRPPQSAIMAGRLSWVPTEVIRAAVASETEPANAVEYGCTTPGLLTRGSSRIDWWPLKSEWQHPPGQTYSIQFCGDR